MILITIVQEYFFTFIISYYFLTEVQIDMFCRYVLNLVDIYY